MNEGLHPHMAALACKYARDLGHVVPSASLDARIDQLVAVEPVVSVRHPVRRWHRPFAWAAAAGLALLTISMGIIIGMRLERSRDLLTASTSIMSMSRVSASKTAQPRFVPSPCPRRRSRPWRRGECWC